MSPTIHSDREQRKWAGVAKRVNASREAKAPLFAWAGLIERVGVDDLVKRDQERRARWFAESVGLALRDTQEEARADAVRFAVWLTLGGTEDGDPEEWPALIAYGDQRPSREPPYVRTWRWRRLFERAIAGVRPTLAPEAVIKPSACMPRLRAAILDNRFKEEAARHTEAGCSRDLCRLAGDAGGSPEEAPCPA